MHITSFQRVSFSSFSSVWFPAQGKGEGTSSPGPRVAAAVKCEPPSDKLRSSLPPLFLTGGRRRRRPSGGRRASGSPAEDLHVRLLLFPPPFPFFAGHNVFLGRPFVTLRVRRHRSEKVSDESFKCSQWPPLVLQHQQNDTGPREHFSHRSAAPSLLIPSRS